MSNISSGIVKKSEWVGEPPGKVVMLCDNCLGESGVWEYWNISHGLQIDTEINIRRVSLQCRPRLNFPFALYNCDNSF